jgi:pimeloyl-ACP methyl ester carboxylesterase
MAEVPQFPRSAGVQPGETSSFARAADGTRLFVHSRDQTPATAGAVRAIFCDGVLCDGFIWKYLWSDLAAKRSLTHWHYRGHGRSAPPSDPDRIDIAAHAEDLMAVRRHVGNPPCVLFGHSMGCQVALECYHRYPERVQGLVLVCGTFGRVTSTFHGIPVLDLILPRLLDLALKAPDVVRAIWTRIPPDVALKVALRAGEINPEKIHAEDIIPYLQHMTHVDFPMFLRMLRAAGEHTAGDYLADVRVPTLIVAGESDTFTPAFLAEAMAKAIPGAELFIVPKGTHVAPIEQPEVVYSRVEAFLSARVRAPAPMVLAR